MSAKLSNEKNELLDRVAKRQGFVDYNVKVMSGSMKGDGYLGIINTINIYDVHKPEKQLHLIMKSAMSEEQLREVTPVRKAYEREIYLYKTVFPEFEQFSKEAGIKNKFTETVEYYASSLADREECIILKNLKENDFKLWNRKIPMNEEHVALVFSTYAKFHATGIALKYLRPEKFEELSKNLKNIFYKEDESEIDKLRFEESCKVVFENGFRAVAGDEKATQGLAKFTQNCKHFFTVDIRRMDKYCTILHGDCWCNNMMFKYTDLENPSKPTKMCLLDWQISQVASFIMDLSYFFYACSSKEVLYNLKRFLKIYHINFTQTIEEAGLDPEEVLSYEELETQWKMFSKYGLFMTLFVMKVVLSESEEAPDLSELAKEGKNILESISGGGSTNMQAVNERIANVIVFMNENDFL